MPICPDGLAPEPMTRHTACVMTSANGREPLAPREWANEAVRRLEADANRSADTHLHTFPLPAAWGLDLYLKDESVHPTGSLKHRLARSLFLYGLCNGWIGPHTTIVEASSGSTAVSEAYFARMLGLPFIAVMPAGTSWTSSPTPSGRPTGGETTTSPSRSTPSWSWSGTRSPPGSWWAPAPG